MAATLVFLLFAFWHLVQARVTNFYGVKIDNCKLLSCKGRCLGKTVSDPLTGCKCDADCVVFGDCCYDYYTQCYVFPTDNSFINFIKSSTTTEDKSLTNKKKIEFATTAECVSFTSNLRNLRMLVINKCPAGFTDLNLKGKCEVDKKAFPIEIPVSVPMLPYWTFSNFYCALCHNYTMEDVVFWPARITCTVPNGQYITKVRDLSSYSCLTIISKPEVQIYVRECDDISKPRCTEFVQGESTTQITPTSLPTTISSDDTPTESTGSPPASLTPTTFTNDTFILANLPTICGAYIFPVGKIEREFANPHCAACVQEWKPETTAACALWFEPFGHAVAHNTRPVVHRFGVFGKQFIFYSDESKILLKLQESHLCTQDEYYDFIYKNCKPYDCPGESFPYFESCINSSYVLSNYSNGDYNTSALHVNATLALFTKEKLSFLDKTLSISSAIGRSQINIFNLDPYSNKRVLPRGIQLTSFKVLSDRETRPLGNVHTLIPGLLRVEMSVPVLLNDINQTLTDLSQLRINHNGDVVDMVISGGIPTLPCQPDQHKTYHNLHILSFGRHLFAIVNDELVDLRSTKFVFHPKKNEPLITDSLTICAPESLQKLAFGLNQACNNITIPVSMYEETENGLILTNGQTIKPENYKIFGNTAQVCVSSIVQKLAKLKIVDSYTMSWFKNINTALALAFKLGSFFISLIQTRTDRNAVCFYALGLISSIIDIIHLLENLGQYLMVLSIILHFMWLYLFYSLWAWCVNMISDSSNAHTKCVRRYVFISLLVPMVTIIICATGDINEPPWNIGYGLSSDIFSASKQVIVYGYIVPTAVSVMGILICHIYRVVNCSIYHRNKLLCAYHATIVCLVILQIGFGCSQALVGNDIFFYLYFASSLITGWTFVFMALHEFKKLSTNVASSRYLEPNVEKEENLYEVSPESQDKLPVSN